MIKYFLLMTVVALTTLGCVPTPVPDTNEKKLLVAEVTFNETLKAVRKNIVRMSVEQKLNATEALVDAKTALDAARFALTLGDVLAFSNQIQTVNSSLTIIRAVLEELEARGVSYERNLKHYNFA